MRQLSTGCPARLSLLDSYVFANIPSPLSAIPYHDDVYCIDRYFALGFPYHLAIHKISNLDETPAPYTKLHDHDFPEINILIGENLKYCIQLGDEITTITGNYSVWIPAGTLHAANVISGEGYYIAIRLEMNDKLK
jgi:hypothetical protein